MKQESYKTSKQSHFVPRTTTPLPKPVDKPVNNKIPVEKKDDVFCHEKDYRQFKTDLLRYHCVRFRENHCDGKQIKSKRQLFCLVGKSGTSNLEFFCNHIKLHPVK